jgi:hypothetical protein
MLMERDRFVGHHTRDADLPDNWGEAPEPKLTFKQTRVCMLVDGDMFNLMGVMLADAARRAKAFMESEEGQDFE